EPMNATIGRMLSSETSWAALKIPIASATPVMISHSGLVCFPAAGKAAVGRRSASMKAQASTMNAATSSAPVSHPSRPSPLECSASEECTMPTYLVTATGRPLRQQPGTRADHLPRERITPPLGLGCRDGLNHRVVAAGMRRRSCRLAGIVGERLGISSDLLAERLVDVDQHLLLSLRNLRVGLDRVGNGRLFRLVLEYPGLNVEGLGGDPQALRDLLENVGARLAQAALDLAQVRVRHPSGLGELANRDLCLLALLANVGANRVDIDRTHESQSHERRLQ